MENNIEIWVKIASAALTAMGTLMLFMIKWIKDDIKDLKNDTKDLKRILEDNGNRLTAIETGLKMFEWFGFKKTKVQGEE